jgi:uncharacterized membrane protein YoaK (UPF0700 family)
LEISAFSAIAAASWDFESAFAIIGVLDGCGFAVLQFWLKSHLTGLVLRISAALCKQKKHKKTRFFSPCQEPA